MTKSTKNKAALTTLEWVTMFGIVIFLMGLLWLPLSTTSYTYLLLLAITMVIPTIYVMWKVPHTRDIFDKPLWLIASFLLLMVFEYVAGTKIWLFHPNNITGLFPLGLLLEEWIWMIAAPILCVTVYKSFNLKGTNVYVTVKELFLAAIIILTLLLIWANLQPQWSLWIILILILTLIPHILAYLKNQTLLTLNPANIILFIAFMIFEYGGRSVWYWSQLNTTNTYILTILLEEWFLMVLGPAMIIVIYKLTKNSSVRRGVAGNPLWKQCLEAKK